MSRSCASCGGPSSAAAGAYLALLYPGASMCHGCGRRTLHCSCSRQRGAPAAGEVMARQLADDPEFREWAAAERRGALFAGRPR